MLRLRQTVLLFFTGATVLYLFSRALGGGRRSWQESAPAAQQVWAEGDWNRSDKTVVVAAMSKHDVHWLEDELPDWNHVVYRVDDPSAPYHTKMNKGNEANPYLTYIVDNYDNLPEVAVFIHYHQKAVHLDKLMLESNSYSIQKLNLDHVRNQGYQNLNCGQDYDCAPWENLRVWNRLTPRMAGIWPIFFPGERIPKMLQGPCCAQFAVSKGAIRKRSKSDYERMHKWLLDTEESDYWSGRVFEYTWHHILGMDSFHCVPRNECFCNAFDICDLKSYSAEMGRPEDPQLEFEKQRKQWIEINSKVGDSFKTMSFGNYDY